MLVTLMAKSIPSNGSEDKKEFLLHAVAAFVEIFLLTSESHHHE